MTGDGAARGGFGLGPYYQNEGDGQERKWFIRGISWGVDIVAVIALAFFAVVMLGTKLTVSGRSMEPLLSSGDVVLLDKLWYNFSEPKRMDVIAFTDPEDETRTYIKRIAGLPGERIQIREGRLFVNGIAATDLSEREPIKTAGLAESEIELAEDEYFVLGDNADTSEDSRFSNVGNVRRDQIRGRVWFRMSPFERLGLIR
ncbi:MAG: signal peptidase I [Lachnospiraceae bacterium]|nr:signal peptidase I [Lachnospiraceae bacterium]